MIVLAVNLLSLPFTAVINAHEHMGAYAYLSIFEAILKLAVAAGVWYANADSLVVYAWLLVAATLLAKGAYATYSIRRYEECRGRWRVEPALAREIGAFAGWNFLGSGAYIGDTFNVNTITILTADGEVPIDPWLTVNPESLNLKAAAGTSSFTVSSDNDAWTVSTAATWFTVEKDGASVKVTAQANEAEQERSASFEVKHATNASLTATVTGR